MNTTRATWIPILGLAAATMWTVTSELLPAGLLIGIARDVHVSDGTAGYLVTAWALTVAGLSLPLTRITRRLDRRTLLVATLVVTGVATILTALAPNYPLLVVARTAAAAGHGLFWAQVLVIGSALVPERDAPRAIAVIVAGPTVASIAMIPALTAWGEHSGWRVSFAVVGVVTTLTAGLLVALLPRMAPVVPATGARRDPSRRLVFATAALGATLLVAHFATFTYIAPILTRVGGLPTSLLSVVLMVFGSAGAVGLAIAPGVIRRYPAAALALTGASLAVSLLAVRAAAGSIPFIIAAVAIWGVVVGALPVIYQTRVLALASEPFRPIAGAVSVVTLNVGIAGGATLGGTLHDALGAAQLPLVAVAIAVLGTAGLVVQRAAVRKNDDASGTGGRALSAAEHASN